MNTTIEQRESEIRALSDRVAYGASRARRRSMIVSVALSVAATAWLTYSYLMVGQLGERREELRRQVASLEAVKAALLADQGWSSDRIAAQEAPLDAIRRTIEANSARREEASRSSAATRAQVTVDVFSRDVDQDVVVGSLRELGFDVDLKPPNPRIPEVVGTNAIWFGEDISISDVKLVAYTLIRAGVTIRTIRSFAPPPLRKRKRIEVGSDTGYLASPPLTIAEIRSRTSFDH